MAHEEIKSRIESTEETKTVAMEGLRARYAFVSQRGYYPDGKILFVKFFFSLRARLIYLFIVLGTLSRSFHTCIVKMQKFF